MERSVYGDLHRMGLQLLQGKLAEVVAEQDSRIRIACADP